MWSIYDTLYCFKTFQEYSGDWENINEIQLRGKRLILVKTLAPFNVSNFLENFILGIWGKILVVLLLGVLASYIFDWFPGLDKKNYIMLVLAPLTIELLGYYITEMRNKK